MTVESEKLEGTLSRIVFKNDNGFVIGSFFDDSNNKFSALGNMINPQVNLNYILTGYWEENQKFGEQFKFSNYESIIPSDTSGIFKYIVRVCKFVGGSVGNKIVERYGEQTLEVMRTSPERLAMGIPGITLDRAKEIQAQLLENEEIEKTMIELEVLLDVPGMRKALPGELIKEFKSKAPDIIKDNPYMLTNFRGISFFLADLVALKVGYKRDGLERKKAAARHALIENLNEGSTWIYKDDLVRKINELIQVPELKAGIDALLVDKEIVFDGGYFAFKQDCESEKMISEIICKIIMGDK